MEVNDTIIYDNSLNSPFEHSIIEPDEENYFKSSAKGVYSRDVNVEYFGYSSGIKTFSTYFTENKNYSKKNVTFEYIYEARNLLHSFSDFRNGASFQNLTYNYNAFSWQLKNENDNQESLKIKLYLYFDLGEAFYNETCNFTSPMEKSSFIIKDGNLAKRIVKYTSNNDIVLKYNQTFNFQVHFPLYFESCKNYKLNLIVAITGFILVGLLLFVIYRTICVIKEDESYSIEENP